MTLSVKSCMEPGTFGIRSSPDEIRECIDEVLDILDGSVKLSIFQSARLDSNVPVEQTVGVIAE